MHPSGRASHRPQRILIVSADMGGGHHATGRALEEAAHRLWPGCDVHWVDTLDAMGRAVGPLFRAIYVDSVEHSPWLYEYFYQTVWRHHWFAEAAKAVIGAWAGRALAHHLDAARPDLVLSTYPMGSTGLAWLRRHRGLDLPLGAWISDFNPHPSWVHPEIDLNLVMHQVAVPVARTAVPHATIGVSALPVERRFRPGDPAPARRSLGIPPDGLLAVVSCGSLGFGDSAVTVTELLDGSPDLRILAIAGRNDALATDLAHRFGDQPRVHLTGWLADMPAALRAADLVITNAGGATALEALACARPVIMHRPIAGHGRANAALMARAGLAIVCTEPGSLAKTIADLTGDPTRLDDLRRTAHRHARSRDLDADLRQLADLHPAVAHRLTAEDALFSYVATPAVPQELGAILLFDPAPDGTPLTRADAHTILSRVPGVHGRLHRRRRWSRPRWIPDATIDPADLVHTRRIDPGADLGPIIDEFYSATLPATHPCAAGLFVTGLPNGRTALLAKLHHALGDGVSVLRAMLSATDSSSPVWATPPRRRLARATARNALRHNNIRHIADGLWTLARAGGAPRQTTPPGTTATPGSAPDRPTRHYELARIPRATLAAATRNHDLNPTELLTASFAEAVHRIHAASPNPPDTVRIMLPWSLRDTRTARATGNRTGAVAIDLPIGPMTRTCRYAVIRDRLRHRIAHGTPQAAHAVVRALGLLPPPLQATAARAAYRDRWFTVLGSVLPGPRRPVRLHGGVITEAYPVLPLAPGVSLAWGALTWADGTSLGITATGRWATDAPRLAREWSAVLTELAAGDPP